MRWRGEVEVVGVVGVRPWMVFLMLPGAEEAWIGLGEPGEPWVGCHLTEGCVGEFQNSVLRLVSAEAYEDSQLSDSYYEEAMTRCSEG